MKKMLIALALNLISICALADELQDRVAAVPNPRVAEGGWVADPAGVITRRKNDINALIDDLERSTSAEIAVVVLPTIGALTPKDFAVAIFEKWQVGKAGQDNGVLVLHVLDQRRIEIETGYGLEGTLPDAKCHWITEEIAVPFFRKGSFADGHYEVVRALIRGIKNPTITHTELVAGWTVQPGATVERVPDTPRRDSIAIEYASLPERIVFGTWTPVWLAGLGAIFFAWVTFAYRSRAKDRAPHDRYRLYAGGLTKLQYLASLPIAASALVAEYARTGTPFSGPLVLIAAFVAMYFYRKRTLGALRDAPRTCECGQPMRKLSESEDDRHLKQGNVAEESIASVDYDVWMCSCGKSQIEAYQGKAAATPCPKCGFKTFRQTGSRTLTPATTMSSGVGETTHSCANCRHAKVETHIIPKISTSSSGTGRSGRSSGRSSFGGGRSGGGGAGSRY